MPPPLRTLALGLCCAALAVAGCGDSEEEASAPKGTPTPEATPEPTKPTIAKPAGKAPNRLVKKDLKVGTGPVAALDRGLNERGFIQPGLGDAGDRIFGTE